MNWNLKEGNLALPKTPKMIDELPRLVARYALRPRERERLPVTNNEISHFMFYQKQQEDPRYVFLKLGKLKRVSTLFCECRLPGWRAILFRRYAGRV